MSSRSLSDFTKNKRTGEDSSSSQTSHALDEKYEKKIGVTLRLFLEDWERLHYLSIQERRKIQHLLLEGLNGVLEKRGLPRVRE